MIDDQNLFYQLALTQVENIGAIFAQRLLQEFGSAENIFKASKKQLLNIEGLGEIRAKSIKNAIAEKDILREINFINKHNIQTYFWGETGYPTLLKQCADAPIILFSKGEPLDKKSKTVAIIGTRKNTDYGLKITESIIEGLADLDITIVSGLAYGIDAIAHRKALQCGLKTVAVVAHGLDSIYPSEHKTLAKEIVGQGAIITEYFSGTKPDKQNFPMRNRIVAGMCDATLVIETDVKGGAMITAKLAASYNREVMAVPGRTTDAKSKGCNYLIQSSIASMITNAEDLKIQMNWLQESNKKSVQTRLFHTLSFEETILVNLLKGNEAMHVDEIMLKTKMSNSNLASLLLNLEFQNIVKSLPGKRYRLC